MDLIHNILNDLKKQFNSHISSIEKTNSKSICYDLQLFQKVKQDPRYNLIVNIPGDENLSRDNIYWRGKPLENLDETKILEISKHNTAIIDALKQINKLHNNTKILLDNSNGITFTWTYRFTYDNGMIGYFGIDNIPNKTKEITQRVLIYPNDIKDLIEEYNKDANIRYIIFPISMYGKVENEDNILTILIYDKKNKNIIRFTPLIEHKPNNAFIQIISDTENEIDNRTDYQLKDFDKHFRKELNIMKMEIDNYTSIYSYVKQANNKTKEIFSKLCDKYDWNPGYYWSIWFVDLLTSNPHLDLPILIAELLHFLWKLDDQDNGMNLFISKYTTYLLQHLLDSRELSNKDTETIDIILNNINFLQKIPTSHLPHLTNAIQLKNTMDAHHNNINSNQENIINDEINELNGGRKTRTKKYRKTYRNNRKSKNK